MKQDIAPLGENRIGMKIRFKAKCKAKGITDPTLIEELFKLRQDDSLRCSICKISLSNKESYLDHDHGSDTFRGYLCHHCNTGLGMFRDSPKLLMQAILYLQKAKNKIGT